MLSMLPEAIMRERVAMLNSAIEVMKREGARDLRVQDVEGYPSPEEGLVHVINAPVRPDVMASTADGSGPVTAFVEVSTALSDENIGRRWQYLLSWTENHHGRMHIFVHPENMDKASAIARHWRIDPHCIRPLARH